MATSRSDSDPALPTSSALVVIGRLGAPYGLQGWHHIVSFTHPIENILQYTHWYIQQKNQWVWMEKMSGRPHGQGLIVHLQDVKTPEQAALYTNALIAVERKLLSVLPPDQFYWADLENLSVQTSTGEILGQIDFLYENTGLDIMVVKSGDKEHHIPFILHETVLSVDLSAGKVIVDWEPPV